MLTPPNLLIQHLSLGSARRPGTTGAMMLALLLWASAMPVYAQADFSGVWQPLYQEDLPERLPGPALRDYLGLPINDSARQFADSWDPSRITLPEEQCRTHVSPYIYRGPTNLRIWEDKDPKTQQLYRDQALHQHVRADPHHLDGWPSTSGSERRSHLDGILDRALRGRHAGCRDDAPQAGMGAAQWPSDERPRDDDGILRAERRHHDAHLRARRSGLPDRAPRQEPGLLAQRARADRRDVALGL